MKSYYISVDIEASGPIPGDYNMLSMGMVAVDDPRKTFYVELKPICDGFIPEAMQKVGGLTLEGLTQTGMDPKLAMERCRDWLASITPSGYKPVFVAWPATFDFMWVHWYFIHFLGSDPFTHSGVDIRSVAMGKLGWHYDRCGKRALADKGFKANTRHTHNALDDAQGQADIFYSLIRGI